MEQTTKAELANKNLNKKYNHSDIYNSCITQVLLTVIVFVIVVLYVILLLHSYIEVIWLLSFV